jgi:hypothetical protein
MFLANSIQGREASHGELRQALQLQSAKDVDQHQAGADLMNLF